MAINPATQYPGKIDTSDPDGYPYGKAQNVAVSGDGTGTPWEKALINDLFGLGQALLGEAGITPTGTPDKVGASQYLEAILGLKRKNYIINPSMAVSQENGDGPTIVGSTPVYIADEITAANTSGTGSLTGTRGAADGLRTVKVTAGSAVTDLSGVKIAGRYERRFETQNVLGLNSKTVVYSAKITTNFSGKIPIAFRRIAPTRTYIVDVDVVSGENTVSVVVPFEANTVSGDADGLGFQLRVAGCNEGTFQTSTTGVWQDGDFISTDQSTQWVKSAGDFVEITAEKLEEGTVPSVFEPNSYATDLAECKRYFERMQSFAADETVLGIGHATSSTVVSAPFYYTEKRTVPVIIGVPTAGAFLIRQVSGLNNPATFTSSFDIGVKAAAAAVTRTTGTHSVGDTFFLAFENESGRYIDINARL
jgi:hypothetical protein